MTSDMVLGCDDNAEHGREQHETNGHIEHKRYGGHHGIHGEAQPMIGENDAKDDGKRSARAENNP